MDVPLRTVGSSGLVVSAVGLGCNNFGRTGTATESVDGTTAVVHAALDAGITLFDTADIYGKEPGLSETFLGEALHGRRDRAVIATKFGHAAAETGLVGGAKASRTSIRRAVEASLCRLRTDWIDLYQLHTPDPHTPIDETLDALDDLVREGKVRYVGHSNFAGWQIADAEAAAARRGTTPFVSAQNHYSLLARAAEREVLPAVRHHGRGFLPYFPLHNGLLTGKFTRDHAPADSRISRQRPHLWRDAPWDALEQFSEFCEAREITMLQGAIGWLLAQPALASVIAGATRPDQVRANAEAGAAWTPTDDDLSAIDALFPLVADPAAG